MIVPMRKLTLLCLARTADAALEELRRLGVLHLLHVRPPEGGEVQQTRARAARARQALREAERAARNAPAEEVGAGGAPANGDALVDEVHALVEERHRALEELNALRAARYETAPFGDFDPELARELEGKGLFLRIYRAGRKGGDLRLPEGAHAVLLGEEGGLLAVVSHRPDELDLPRVPLPPRRLSEIESDIALEESRLEQLGARLAAGAAALPALRNHVAALEAQLAFVEARHGMGAEGEIAYLRGYCPEDAVDAVRGAARRHGWGLLDEAPAAGDAVPTLLRNPAWIRPIAALMDFIKILPGYGETDVSASFLVFMSLFFAMIIGDAGYGLLFFVITRLARLRWPKAPSAPFTLLTLFSAATVAWGVATGVYFGVTGIPGPLRALRVDWLTDNRNVMGLCLLIGAIHLSVAHAWKALLLGRSTLMLAQLGWLGVVWTIYFGARTLLLGIPFPFAFIPVGAAGLLAVVLFMTPVRRLREEWINHAMLPLTLMSNFGDVLSYIRLFALGVASVQLASAFNSIVTESLGFSSPLAGLFSALLLFAGHTVNIVLSLMSVLVHGIRLNALEFSMHMGLEWTGTAYRPFALPQPLAAYPGPGAAEAAQSVQTREA